MGVLLVSATDRHKFRQKNRKIETDTGRQTERSKMEKKVTVK